MRLFLLTVLLLAAALAAKAQNLFVSTWPASITEFTPDGMESIFTSGLNAPRGLAFDNAGNLFVADMFSGNIYKFTPDGVKITFASGLNSPRGLAVDSAGNVFVANGSGYITKFTPDGTPSSFASGLGFLKVWRLTARATCLWCGILSNSPPAKSLKLHQMERKASLLQG